ncbi:hypothetical protein GIB67_007096 [Kingdonia uniflora]|uniref:Uncharacterized protein n=1 Tax=Kingdonia uniflora TaxID=39325 RepID=A0A7J7ML79_9MAGN|nr:hypothetical protein GIB67_007096 [Kingdonia uniflora]
MKSDKEANEQVDEKNQTQEGRAKKGTSNVKNYTSRYTSLGLHKIFAALPEVEKGVLHTTCFVPLQLIDLIGMMSTLVVEIIDRHLEDVLRLNLLKIILSFLLPNKGRNMWVKYIDLVDDLQQFNRFPWEKSNRSSCNRRPLAIGVIPAIEPPTVGISVIGNSSFATEIRAVVVRQVAPEERLEVENYLMVDDDDKVGREVNFNAISSEYGGDLLEIEESKNGNEKVEDVEKDGEEKESKEE